ncbi:MAG: GAF domain-containing sensor histidine kinase [Actinobacteria bacterium]|nr:GAF domain-containing sensor histidine kinase [Actinomycetota bacterium]
MSLPGAGLDDGERLRVLDETGLVDSPAEDAFDRYTRLVARNLAVPVALISLVDDTRQFFKSQTGLPEPWASRRETPLTHSFCQHVVTSAERLVVEDAPRHALVCDNLAIPDLGVVAYAGAPLRTPDGSILGSLCAIDHQPRTWTDDELATLDDLAAAASGEIAARLAARRHAGFARQAAHQLRTPLTGLRIRMEDLAGRPGTPPTAAEELRDMLGEVQRLADAVNTILDLAEQATIRDRERVDIGRALAAAAARWRPAVGAVGRDVTADADADVDIAVHAAGLDQILDVLVENALHHGRGRIRLEFRVQGRWGAIRVVDEGPGLPDATVSRLTSRRTATFGSDGGPVGLSLARQVAEAMGARLLVRPERPRWIDLIVALDAAIG